MIVLEKSFFVAQGMHAPEQNEDGWYLVVDAEGYCVAYVPPELSVMLVDALNSYGGSKETIEVVDIE